MCDTSEANISDYVALISVIIALLTIITNYLLNRLQFRDKILESEREEIYKKLNEFYGPFLQLRHSSSKLHERFKNGRKFSTLVELLKGNEFDGNDKVLLEEIIRLGLECQKLIKDKAGLIDDYELRAKHLPIANRHYFTIQKAAEGKLKGESIRFNIDKFPKEIDTILEQRFAGLQERLTEINKKSKRII